MEQSHNIHVTGRPLGAIRHICAFFHSKEEEYEALMDFVAEGFDRREKAFHIVDDKHREDHRARLQREACRGTSGS
jgi:hypothetical protein